MASGTINKIKLADLNGVSKDAVELSNGDDLNDCHESGFYYIYPGVKNAPEVWSWCIVCNGLGTMQMLLNANKLYVRYYTGTPLEWTQWVSVSLL